MRRALLGLLFLWLLGCGAAEPSGLPLVPVQGKLHWKGQPLAGATVTFVPRGATVGWGATGVSREDGSYQVVETGGRPGIPMGEYQVTVSRRVLPDGKPVPPGDTIPPAESPARESLPPAYSDANQTILRATVPAHGGTFDFTLPPK